MDINTQIIDCSIKTCCKEKNVKVMDNQEYITLSNTYQPILFRFAIPIEANIYPEMFNGLVLPFNEVYYHIKTKSDTTTRRTYYIITFHIFLNQIS
jgi:hypothetical protein